MDNKFRANALTEEALELLYAKIKALPYWTDGVVFRIISNDEYLAAGAVGPDPRLACAFKFPPESTQTTVVAVDFDVGATGVICPRAILAPITVAGTTVTYATLHNFDNIAKLGLAVGDTVEVHKAGEIIPQVVRVLERPGHLAIVKPYKCPCCAALTAQKETGEGEGAHLVCTNHRCGARRTPIRMRVGTAHRGEGRSAVGGVSADFSHLQPPLRAVRILITPFMTSPFRGRFRCVYPCGLRSGSPKLNRGDNKTRSEMISERVSGQSVFKHSCRL